MGSVLFSQSGWFILLITIVYPNVVVDFTPAVLALSGIRLAIVISHIARFQVILKRRRTR
jgi:hypothetical protein